MNLAPSDHVNRASGGFTTSGRGIERGRLPRCGWRGRHDARPNIDQPVRTMDRLRETAWQLPWLRLHLTARELLSIPASSYAWPAAKRALAQCVELRRRMIETGTFN
jgi:hypothetical protein